MLSNYMYRYSSEELISCVRVYLLAAWVRVWENWAAKIRTAKARCGKEGEKKHKNETNLYLYIPDILVVKRFWRL